MWIPQPEQWNTSHTKLSKYFLERVKQKVDPRELISNKHRTSNGYTLIKEIITVAQISVQREKSFSRYKNLLHEATSLELPFSIPNDYILVNYFPDVIKYYSDLIRGAIKNETHSVNTVITQSKIYAKRLDKGYFKAIESEVEKIDFSDSNFNRYADIIDEIVDCMLPYLLYQGYSTTGIDKAAFYLSTYNDGKNAPKKLLSYHNLSKSKYSFLISDDATNDELIGIKEYLERKEINYSEVYMSQINKNHFNTEEEIDATRKFLWLKHNTVDPHAFIRNLYDKGLKDYVQKKDRENLSYFTNFFDKVFWRSEGGASIYKNSKFHLDPISVPDRGSTLIDTLFKYSPETNIANFKLNYRPQLLEATYFYNLAIGSKSIENSLFLLWTSLESIVPYRMHKNDIANIQHFVSTSLGFGTIIRELSSFIMRMIETNRINYDALSILEYNGVQLCDKYYEPKKDILVKWSSWLCEDHMSKKVKPFYLLEATSNLLCRQYTKLYFNYNGLGDDGTYPATGPLGTVKYWLDKIESSELAIQYQMDRIYLHRNQIVHSGKFVNEYSNLWSHLEWYIGKLLAFAYIRLYRYPEMTVEQIFIELEASSQEIKNIIKNNQDKTICELRSFFPTLFKHSWQSF